MEKGPFLFISYCVRNVDIVTPIVRELVDRGYSISYGEFNRNSANPITMMQQMQQDMERSVAICVFLSDDFYKSMSATWMLDYILHTNKDCIFLSVDHSPLPDKYYDINQFQILEDLGRSPKAVTDEIIQEYGDALEVCRIQKKKTGLFNRLRFEQKDTETRSPDNQDLVFISYSHFDKITADAICAKLEQNSIRCWYAPRDAAIGDAWAESIDTAIKKSKVLILVFSDSSNVSVQVRKEITLAINSGLVIIPYRVKNTMPDGAMNYYLSDLHWIDAYNLSDNEALTEIFKRVKSMLNV